MPIRLKNFVAPERVVKDDSEPKKPNFARYIAEPFEIGYARTIGNSLRRVLLSSIEGCAISSVKITGIKDGKSVRVPHEFFSLDGVREDVTEIVLALKKVLVRIPVAETAEVVHVFKKAKGVSEITAGVLFEGSQLEVLNPDHHVATVDENGELEIELKVTRGRGFCPATWDVDPSRPDETPKQTEIGVIPLDRIYSPVARVNFEVANSRVGQHTDYEKLILEITTDGRVDPDTALVRAADTLRQHLDVFVNLDKDLVEKEPVATPSAPTEEDFVRKLNLSVNEIELSVRAANCLNIAKIATVGELCLKKEDDMLKFRNFGKKSLGEIKEKLHQMGLSLGMEFEPSLIKSAKPAPEAAPAPAAQPQ